MAASHDISRPATDLLQIALRGDLDEETVSNCAADTRALLSHAPPGVRIVIDMLAVDGYSLEARDALASLQRSLRDKSAGTAYLASTGQMRGFALWASRMSGDDCFVICKTREEATRWLDSDQDSSGVRRIPDADTRANRFRTG